MSEMNLSDLSALLSDFRTLSEEAKKKLLNLLQNDEEFPEDFWDTIEQIIDREIAFAEKKQKEVKEKSEELKTAKETRDAKIQKMYGEFSNLCEQEFQKFEAEEHQIAQESDKKMENIVHESENGEIDSIRKNLGLSS